MLPRESKFDAKVLVHGINRTIFWEVHPVCALPSNLSLKTPVFVRLITK